MMQESMAKSAELMQSKIPALMKRLDERMSKEFPEMADQPTSKTPKKPPSSH
jgi:hypothetical protein